LSGEKYTEREKERERERERIEVNYINIITIRPANSFRKK